MRHIKSTALILAFYLGALALAFSPFVILPLIALFPWEYDVFLLLAIGGCLLIGPLVLWAIVPRAKIPDLDGIAMDPARQSGLFSFIRSVARRTRQAMPTLVLVNGAAHAAAGFYRGFAGFRSQRVLSVGLPFFAVLSVTELSALVAHELGHFFKGSMFYWAWIVETQQAIGRFFTELERNVPILIPVFERLLTPFVRACLEVSRQQEHAADRFAAEHFGAETLKRALEQTRHLEAEYGLYFQAEVLPALHAGFAPPLIEGFRDFRRNLSAGATPRLHHGVKTDDLPPFLQFVASEFQTHPDFDARLDAIGQEGGRPASGLNTPALTLIHDLPSLERRLLGWEAQKRGLPAPVPMAWHRGAEEIYLRQWRASAAQYGSLFEGHALRDLPALIRQSEDYGQRMTAAPVPAEQAAFAAQQALGAAMCVTLENQGWTLDYRSPGQARAFVKDGARVDPFEIVEKLAWEEMASFEWEDQAVELGIADLELGAPATSVSPAG